MLARLKWLWISLAAVAAIGTASVWGLIWLSSNHDQAPSVQGTPLGSTPLTVDSGSSSANNTNIVGGNAPQSQSTTGADDFSQYEQYKNAKNILLGEVQKGTGATAAAGKTVAIAYDLHLTNGKLVDQTQKQAFAFQIGAHRVIPGMEQGVLGMKVGGTRRIIVPPAWGYGSVAHKPIPANSVLVFDVQLLVVK